MLVTMNFDFANPVHAQIFAQVCAQCTSASVPMQMHDFASVSATSVAPTPTPVSTPASTPKEYAPATDVECAWVLNKTLVTYTLADGKYAGQTGVRKTLNARLRSAGAEWNAEKKAWAFKSSKAALAFVESDVAAHYDTLDGISVEHPTLVTAQEIESVREKAQARASKKGAQA